MKEGADDLWSSAQAAQGEADAVLQNVEVGRAEAGQGMLLHPGPQPFVRVEFGGVGGQAIDAEAVSVVAQDSSGGLGAVGVQSVPEQKDGAGKGAEQVADKGDELGAADGAPHQAEIGAGVGRDGRDGRELRPVEAVIEKRRLAAWGPGLAGGGQQREATLVEKDQRGLQSLGVFFRRGQVRPTQRWMAASSRSRARRAGFCQLHPKRCNRRQT